MVGALFSLAPEYSSDKNSTWERVPEQPASNAPVTHKSLMTRVKPLAMAPTARDRGEDKVN